MKYAWQNIQTPIAKKGNQFENLAKTLKCPKENLDIASIPQYRPPSYITRKLGCNNKS